MNNIKLMDGFPPSTKSQVTLANWRKPPFNKWSFHHVQEIIPSANIPNDHNLISVLNSAPINFDNCKIDFKGTTFSWNNFLKKTNTNAIVILHRGEVVYENYIPEMTPHTQHILMSVSKSILGMLVGILAERGELSLNHDVTDLVPEIGSTAYRGAKLQNLLDMRSAIKFDENYLASTGPIIDYRKAQNWDPVDPGDSSSDLRSFFSSLTGDYGTHGGNFQYVSPNTDLLGLVLERATGKRYADLVSELLWKPMGASDNAYITLDRLGAPRCAGGFCSTVRDLALFGQLILKNGQLNGNQIIPSSWINDTIESGDSQAWNAGNFAKFFPDMPMQYRNKWYVMNGIAPLLFGVGVYGQNVFIDQKNEIVIAKFSSQSLPMDENLILLTMQAVAAVQSFIDRH